MRFSRCRLISCHSFGALHLSMSGFCCAKCQADGTQPEGSWDWSWQILGTLDADYSFWMDSSSKQTQNIYVVPAYCRIVRWRIWADQCSPPLFLFLSLSFTSLCILIGFCAPCCSCCLYTGGVLDLDICAEECKIGSILVPTSTHLSFCQLSLV